VPAFSDADVLKLLAKGEVSITPFREANLTPNGYDVTIAEVVVPSTDEHVTSGNAVVPAQTRFAVSTEEVLELGPGVAAELWIRTTWGRRGVLASFGMIDSGFRGTLTLPAFNASHEPLELPIGERFAQVVFLMLTSPSDKGYEKRSGHYQGQEGVRLS
jgi:dCTP deaminase